MSTLDAAFSAIKGAQLPRSEQQFLRRRAVEFHFGKPGSEEKNSSLPLPFSTTCVAMLEKMNHKLQGKCNTMAQALRLLRLRKTVLSSKLQRSLRVIDTAATFERHPAKLEEVLQMLEEELQGTQHYSIGECSGSGSDDTWSSDGDKMNGEEGQATDWCPQSVAMRRPAVDLNTMDDFLLDDAAFNGFNDQEQLAPAAASNGHEQLESAAPNGHEQLAKLNPSSSDAVFYGNEKQEIDELLGTSFKKRLDLSATLPAVPNFAQAVEFEKVEEAVKDEKTKISLDKALPTDPYAKDVGMATCSQVAATAACSMIHSPVNGIFFVTAEQELPRAQYQPVTLMVKSDGELGGALQVLHSRPAKWKEFVLDIRAWRPIKTYMYVDVGGITDVYWQHGVLPYHIWVRNSTDVEWSFGFALEGLRTDEGRQDDTDEW